jgi:hypothetical protein
MDPCDDDHYWDYREQEGERKARNKWCPVCRTMGGHLAGCPETPDPEPEKDDESNGEE